MCFLFAAVVSLSLSLIDSSLHPASLPPELPPATSSPSTFLLVHPNRLSLASLASSPSTFPTLQLRPTDVWSIGFSPKQEINILISATYNIVAMPTNLNTHNKKLSLQVALPLLIFQPIFSPLFTATCKQCDVLKPMLCLLSKKQQQQSFADS